MMKKVLYFSVLCLLFVTISYTYSAFTNKVVGNIVATSNNWSFKVNVENGSIENDYYKVPITSSSGQVNIILNTSSSNNGAEYTIELTGYNLPSDITYYKDSSYSSIIGNNIYKGNIKKNTSKTVTIYYKSSSTINGYLYIKVKGNVYTKELAMMKNSVDDVSEYYNYCEYIKTIEFSDDLSSMPTSCTSDNLCWDISYSSTQDKKIYAHLIDNGEKDSTNSNKSLYTLYIVSDAMIAAPYNCKELFSFRRYDSLISKTRTNLVSINFNNNFDTSEVTNMQGMFQGCTLLSGLNLNDFDTSKVTNMKYMFYDCSSLMDPNLSSFDTSKVTDMSWMFFKCICMNELNVSSFDTSKVTDMNGMFGGCSPLTSLDLSSFNTSNVVDMSLMFDSCQSLKNLNLINFDTRKVTDMHQMFYNCSSLNNLDLSNFNTQKVTNTRSMFYNCSKLIVTINMSSNNITEYGGMFTNAATDSNAQITVNYTNDNSTLVDQMIATKSVNSNVVKGSLIS